MPLPDDYLERAYAGVLGKLIGVYLGRPFEGWPHERIAAELGEVWYYAHERLGAPLVVTDDDLAGTFTFLRALPDHGHDPGLTPAQIGQTWLNYIVEGRSVLWWGGMGNSTEHTAYLRLKAGVLAPASGSVARNGRVVAEQIGAQIFVDGWAMVCPGDPERAADLARRAASVSHDGEALHAAQLLAAMEAQAFVERDLGALLDAATRLIPPGSTVARLVHDLREWRERHADWREARALVARHYGYDRYGGNCHIIPNHALIHLGLLYGEDDFQRALMVTSTAGWDTDCNAGNVGCLMGIKNGLAGIDAGPDWRGPVADRLYLPTADGGRAITDAVAETYRVVNIGRALAGEPPLAPKGGARFHFELPGSLQGWAADDSPEARGTLELENVAGHSARGSRSLALRYRGLAPGRAARAATATFIPPEARAMPGYQLLASPTLYPGQTVRASLSADPASVGPVACRLVARCYGAGDRLEPLYGAGATLAPGARHTLAWRVPDTGGRPVASLGLEVAGAPAGALYLDELTWDGPPEAALGRPAGGGTMWRRAWVDAVDQWDPQWPEPFRLVQNAGLGMVSTGTREWRDYAVSARVTPHMAEACGVAARHQGLRRYVALTLGRDGAGAPRLALAARVEEAERGEAVAFAWEPGRSCLLRLEVRGRRARAWADGRELLALELPPALDGGGVALLCAEGCVAFDGVAVAPAGAA